VLCVLYRSPGQLLLHQMPWQQRWCWGCLQTSRMAPESFRSHLFHKLSYLQVFPKIPGPSKRKKERKKESLRKLEVSHLISENSLHPVSTTLKQKAQNCKHPVISTLCDEKTEHISYQQKLEEEFQVWVTQIQQSPIWTWVHNR